MRHHQPLTDTTLRRQSDDGVGVCPVGSPEAKAAIERVRAKLAAESHRRVDVHLAGSPEPVRGKTRKTAEGEETGR